jgi:hypothetical protein
VAGIWLEDNPLPGSVLEITVILNGSNISGFGSWCDQGKGCGVTTESGTVTTSGIQIVTNFDDGRIQTFDGSLRSESSLVGMESDTPPDSQLRLLVAQSFTRVLRDPPN